LGLGDWGLGMERRFWFAFRFEGCWMVMAAGERRGLKLLVGEGKQITELFVLRRRAAAENGQ
jgi:hypothetical protein